jgi:ParB-like chromosome segregation protein Spo0J
VEIDLHRLELRHRDLRIVDADRRRRLIGSIAEIGQQVPAVVIADSDRFVLIDGYMRVEARLLGGGANPVARETSITVLP